MKSYEVTILETVAPGSHMEITVVVEADDPQAAIDKVKPPYPSRYGRSYVVKELKP